MAGQEDIHEVIHAHLARENAKLGKSEQQKNLHIPQHQEMKV